MDCFIGRRKSRQAEKKLEWMSADLRRAKTMERKSYCSSGNIFHMTNFTTYHKLAQIFYNGTGLGIV